MKPKRRGVPPGTVSQGVSQLERFQARMRAWNEHATSVARGREAPKQRVRPPQAMPQPLEPRFVAKVDRRGDGECWPWLGSKRRRGYGMISVRGRLASAHRVAWELANGRRVPRGLVIMHRCDNPACCNPRHLIAATQKENIADMIAKGRSAAQKKGP